MTEIFLWYDIGGLGVLDVQTSSSGATTTNINNNQLSPTLSDGSNSKHNSEGLFLFMEM